MKLDTFLFILTLVLAFGTGNLTYFLKSKKVATIEDIDEINMISIDLRNERRPIIRVDLNSLYPSTDHLKLLDDSINLITGAASFSIHSMDCSPFVREYLSLGKSKKFKTWLDHECGVSIEINRDFFEKPPFQMESGESYAYLKYQQLYRLSDKLAWLEKYSRYMHIKELRKIQHPLPRQIDFLRSIPRHTLKQILVGYTRILSKNFYFIKTANRQYFVVPRILAEREYRKSGYLMSTSGHNCFFNAGNICWKKRPHNVISFLSQTSIILFLFTLFIFVLIANMLYHRIRKQKLEEERKKHALRVLTHELRTPVASLLLHVQNMMKNSSNDSQERQDDLLRIESDVYRLKHLAEKSQGYLQTDSTDLMSFKKVKVDSLKEYCEDIIFEYPELNIQLDVIKDNSLTIDPYWLKLCITNLIENARRYGVPPISLKLNEDNQNILISVKDHGQIKAKNLSELIKKKNENSKGLGLGLIIIKKTIHAMGGRFSLINSPTEFTISLPKDQNE